MARDDVFAPMAFVHRYEIERDIVDSVVVDVVFVVVAAAFGVDAGYSCLCREESNSPC